MVRWIEGEEIASEDLIALRRELLLLRSEIFRHLLEELRVLVLGQGLIGVVTEAVVLLQAGMGFRVAGDHPEGATIRQHDADNWSLRAHARVDPETHAL